MTTQLLWFTLAGFVLGFTTSTLWEWFHFRRERVKLRDRQLQALEAKVRELEAAAEARPASTDEGWAPPYRSPGVFLESEEAQPPVAAPAPRREQVPPVISAPAERPLTGRALRSLDAPARRPKSPARTRSETVPEEVLPEPEDAAVQPAPAREDGVRVLGAWAADADLVRRSQEHPDDLSKVKGIGDVYRQRLFRAGIYTWHQVATSDVATLRRATHAYPSSNVEEWPEQARQLAERHGRAGAVYRGPAPDELTKILGIGPVTAQSLYRAGICTYEQLAVTSKEDLAALFPIAVAGDQPDFDRWIAQAVQLADSKHAR
jgi:predicted flap endonuclease-1-like 5' DNA nuclease